MIKPKIQFDSDISNNEVLLKKELYTQKYFNSWWCWNNRF